MKMTQTQDEELANQQYLQTALEAFTHDPSPKNLDILRQLSFNNFPNWHFPMMQDQARLNFYQKCFEGKLNGKVVLDVGAGGGLLSALAVQLGAKKIYAIERHPTLCTILKVIFAEQIKSGVFTLIEKDTQDLTQSDFKESPEVLIHEIFSIDGVGEGVLKTMDDLRAFPFWKDMELIPHHFQLWVELISWPEGVMKMPYKQVGSISFNLFSELARMIPEQLTHSRAQNEQWQSVSKSYKIFDHQLKESLRAKEFVSTIELSSDASPTHVRLWFECSDQYVKHQFSSNLKDSNNHWGNYCYPIPEEHFSGKLNVHFEISSNGFRIINF
jgi:hypothetical protein